MEDVNTGSKEIDEIDEALKEFATQRRKGPLATMASSSEKIQQYPTLQGLRCSGPVSAQLCSFCTASSF
jgi:hypothetical protein